MDKKREISNKFVNNLFSKKKIDDVDDKMEDNLSILLESEDYLNLNREFKDVSLKLMSTLDSEQRKILEEYQRLELDITSYQNGLAYYLGCKTMIDVSKLK